MGDWALPGKNIGKQEANSAARIHAGLAQVFLRRQWPCDTKRGTNCHYSPE